MGWSTRQVWGFTALILGVIVLSIVGMVTMVLYLMMGHVPEGDPLVTALPTATPTTTPTPTTDEALPPITCDPSPEDALVFLPDHCAIIITSPSSPSSPSLSVQLLPYFNMRRCPNHMCTPDSCHGDRCCCQTIQLSSLSYQCPNERVVLVENIVEQCGCTPCAGMPVVFIGMVTDTENTPIPAASVLINGRDMYTADEEAIFGFAVPASQEEVVVMVTAEGYSQHRQSLAVMPGEVNILRVILLRELSHTLSPTPAAILVNVFSLAVLPLSPSPDLVSPLEGGGGANAESFIEFPEGFFASETTTLIGQQVTIDNEASLQSLGMSFVVLVSGDFRRRRETDDMELRQRGEGLEGEGGRGRGVRSAGVREEMVFVVSVGVLDVVGEDGERVKGNMTDLVLHTYLPSDSYTCSEQIPFQLYLLTDMGLARGGGNVSCTSEGGRTHLQASLPPNTPLPLTYLLGTPDAEGDTCYIAVRAFEPTSMGNLTEITTSVWLLTKSLGALTMVNAMFGHTGECVSIPCQGEGTVRILDGLKYTPESYTIILGDDVSDDVIEEGVVYKERSECEDKALGEEAAQPSFFQFIVSPRLPTLSIPNDANLTTPPFCSLRVGVVLPMGVAMVHVTAYSESSDGERMVRVGRVVSEGGSEGVEVGSGECVDCEETHITCLQVSCDYQVAVHVSSMGEDRVVCVPVVREGDEGGGVEVEGGRMVLGEGVTVKGLVADNNGPDPSVAMEMCKLGSGTDIWFHCIT